ncbi:MAG TPA: hypothetical protein VGU67_12145 [Edaphobacter sp.]|nr:hypothetical protein [Edaphobacter sp.]
MMLLRTDVRRGRIVGTLIGPSHFMEDSAGGFSGISMPMDTRPVTGRWKGSHVELAVGRKPDRDKMPMTLPDKHHALLGWAQGNVPAWKFERVAAGQKIVVATDWPRYNP